MEVRNARPGDGEALALIWAENAAYYFDLFPDDFRLHHSEPSMPFWAKRMRYTPHSVIFKRRLRHPTSRRR